MSCRACTLPLNQQIHVTKINKAIELNQREFRISLRCIMVLESKMLRNGVERTFGDETGNSLSTINNHKHRKEEEDDVAEILNSNLGFLPCLSPFSSWIQF